MTRPIFAAVLFASLLWANVLWAAPAISGAGGATPAPAARTTGNPSTGSSKAAAPTPLPPARSVDAIVADVVAALGGAAAVGRHRSQHTKMQITFKGLGISGTAEHWGAAGDKALTVTAIPNLASTREGSDGTHFWSEDPINGLRILEGAEAEQARIEVAWNAELRIKELFAKVEAKNEISDDGMKLECLTLTPKMSPALTECFDAKTHLMALERGVRSGPQGDMPFTAKLTDWRDVGDVKVAYATDMQVGPLAFTGRLTAVELDIPVDDHLFAVPVVAKAGSEATRGAGGAGGKSKARPTRKMRVSPALGSTAAPTP